MDLAGLTKSAERRAESPDNGADIAAAARAKEAREDRAHHYAIVAANATERSVTFSRSYRVGDESRTVRERVAPASRVNGRELLTRCREAARLGAAKLERKGLRISDEDRLDAAAELCARTLEGTHGALPKRDAVGKTYMRERAAGIVLDVFRKRRREELTGDFDLIAMTERAECRATDNAPDPYLEDATGDPAAPYLRAAARALDPWPGSPVEAAVVHAAMPAVPSTQWATHEGIAPSTWRSRCQAGREQLAGMPVAEVRSAVYAAERAECSYADDVEAERAELEQLIGQRP